MRNKLVSFASFFLIYASINVSASTSMEISRISYCLSMFSWSHTSSTKVVRTSSTLVVNGTAHRALTELTDTGLSPFLLTGE